MADQWKSPQDSDERSRADDDDQVRGAAEGEDAFDDDEDTDDLDEEDEEGSTF